VNKVAIIFLRPRRALVFALLLMLTVGHGLVAAQTVMTAQGIAGHMDKSNRDPILSVRPEVSSTGVKILADAYVPNEDFRQYPIEFQFYVNRRLFSTQIRSPELPGPVGVFVGPDVATTPFNYAVVAKMLFPNRVFTTVLQAAVFDSAFAGVFDCTVILVDTSDEELIFVANGVQTTQSVNTSFSLVFDADETDGSEVVSIETTLFVIGEAVSGNLFVNRGGLLSEAFVSGSIVADENQLIEFDVSSSDETVNLNCS